jgi:hypothetical protein
MAIQRSIPMSRMISGNVLHTSEICLVSELEYTTNGEALIVTKELEEITINLNNETTDHIIIKALTKTRIVSLFGKIDEEFKELQIDKGASVELYFSFGHWYIVSSDGIKES